MSTEEFYSYDLWLKMAFSDMVASYTSFIGQLEPISGRIIASHFFDFYTERYLYDELKDAVISRFDFGTKMRIIDNILLHNYKPLHEEFVKDIEKINVLNKKRNIIGHSYLWQTPKSMQKMNRSIITIMNGKKNDGQPITYKIGETERDKFQFEGLIFTLTEIAEKIAEQRRNGPL